MTESWVAYDHTVQQYRIMALLAGGFELVAGVLTLGMGFIDAFFALAVLSLCSTWALWWPVIYCRHLVVDFHKHSLGSRYSPDGTPGKGLDEKTWARIGSVGIRRRVRKHAQLRTLRATRRAIDVFVPVARTLVWLVLLTTAAALLR